MLLFAGSTRLSTSQLLYFASNPNQQLLVRRNIFVVSVPYCTVGVSSQTPASSGSINSLPLGKTTENLLVSGSI